MVKVLCLTLALMWCALFVLACSQETTITGPDCFAKADAGGGAGGSVVPEGEGAGAPGGSAKAESGCSGASVAHK
jgi:hypothetical protein